ncbi:c-type cytochrome [Duganella sp. FT135W]|uniref:C-type cytochrome n=1 Tax=Duganella flavida TaxID=2692175 RepID=A0A6L8K7X1_9BURK|nr:c-type cytochrome [Duganella flavida]MYM22647.1 c-type cytochrome [Duganella flavida]
MYKLIATGFVFIAYASSALANEELAQKKNCLVCHSVSNKIVGPAYQDVAKKYAGDKKAEAMLVKKVIAGGSGVWGQTPMPPNNITEAEAHTLVRWILAQK